MERNKLRYIAAAAFAAAAILFLCFSVYRAVWPRAPRPATAEVEDFAFDLAPERVASVDIIDTHPSVDSLPSILADFEMHLSENSMKVLKRAGFSKPQREDLVKLSVSLLRYAIDPDFARDYQMFSERGLVAEQSEAEKRFEGRRKKYTQFRLAPLGIASSQVLVLSSPNDVVSRRLTSFNFTKVDVGSKFSGGPMQYYAELVVPMVADTVKGPSRDPQTNVLWGCRVGWDAKNDRWIPTELRLYKINGPGNVVTAMPLGF